MTKKERILNNIRMAIQLVVEGESSPFNDKEYDEMFVLLNQIEKNKDI